MNKNLEFNDLIDFSILKMRAGGIHDSRLRHYDDIDGEAGNCWKREEGVPLNLFATIFFFLILFVGIVLSFFLFIIEVSLSKCKIFNIKEKDFLKL